MTVNNEDAVMGEAELPSQIDTAPVGVTAETPVVELKELDSLGQILLEQTINDVTEAAELNAKVQSVRDEAKTVSDKRETSEAPEVVSFREWLKVQDEAREEAVTKIDAFIKANLMTALDPNEVEANEVKLAALKTKIKAGVAYASTNNPDFEAHLPEAYGTVFKSAGGGAKKGQGFGGKKPRIAGVYLNGVIADHETKDAKTGLVDGRKSTFTDAVREIQKATGVKVATSDLHRAYFDAAGSEDMDKIADSVEFKYEAGEGEKRQNYTVMVTKLTD